MLEQSLSSSPTFWASVYSWFTPTVFFLLLQLVIATIYITLTLANSTHKHHHHQDPNFPQQQQLFRSPSVLQRLKSINLYSYFPSKLESTNVVTYEKHHHVEVKETEEEDALGDIKDNLGGLEEDGHVSLEEVFMKLQGQGGNFARTHSDTNPDSGEVPVKLSRKMKKSASSKSPFSHFKEDDIVESRRPATVKEAKVVTMDEDELVDSKADDFINKFNSLSFPLATSPVHPKLFFSLSIRRIFWLHLLCTRSLT